MKIIPWLLCLLLSGCYLQSLNKFYTEDLKVDVPQIEGDWVSLVQMGDDVAGLNLTAWNFSKDQIETYDKDNTFTRFSVTYFRIDDNIFMDISAGSLSIDPNKRLGNCYAGSVIAGTHTLCKVIADDKKMVIIPANMSWFEKKIEKMQLSLNYIKPDKNSNFIFIASTDQWIPFLKLYGNDAKVFSDEQKFVFKRKPPTGVKPGVLKTGGF